MGLESNFISVVAYLHKNDRDVSKFLSLLRTMSESFSHYELIFVNDGAPESVIDQVRRYKSDHKDTNVTLITMGYCHGLESSMNAGIDLAIGDYVIEFDSCLVDYPPELIIQVYQKCITGYDIVSAVPGGMRIKPTTTLFYKLYNCYSRHNGQIGIERFRIISRRALNRAHAYSEMIPYRKAVYASIGLPMASIAYKSADANSSYKFINISKEDTAIDSLILFTKVGARSSLCILIVFAVLCGVFSILESLSLISKGSFNWLIAIGLIVVLMLLSMLVCYLDVLIKLVFRKQKYTISGIEKL